MLSAKNGPMGRPPLNFIAIPGRYRKGTRERIKAVLEPGEKQAEFMRKAVETELSRRERATKRKLKPPASPQKEKP